VTINNVNNGYNNNPTDPSCPAVNPEYYINNEAGTTIVFDGFTTVLQARAHVICGETYHIKLAIGDALDQAYDSGVFLQAGSFSANVLPLLAASTLFGDGTCAEGCSGTHFTIIRPEGIDTTMVVPFYFTGTSTAGLDYDSVPNPIIIPEGVDSVLIPFEAIDDGIPENVETVIMNVFAVNTCGDTLTNSVILAIVDYHPMVITSPTPLLLQCDQDSVPLNASVSGGFGEVTLAWGDTLYSNQVYVPGRESASYTIYAHDQCPRTVTATVDVDDGCKVIIPNVITPNSDGENDKFVIKGIEGRENHVRIYDRWGKEVLNVTNYRNNFAAADLHDGVYFYIVRVKDDEYTGNLQVLGSK
jgi:gliding motility-associated-like protein